MGEVTTVLSEHLLCPEKPLDFVQTNGVIRDALATQHDGHGDSRPAPSRAEIKEFIMTTFPNLREEARHEFWEACESLGKLAVTNKISNHLIKSEANDLLEEYFGGHIRESQSRPKGHMGPKSMSFFLQSRDHPEFKPRKEKICLNFSESDFFSGLTEYVPVASRNYKRITPSLHMASACFPSGWEKKELTVGDTETKGQESLVADAFNCSEGLEILLLLNKLYGGESWQLGRMLSGDFRLFDQYRATAVSGVFDRVEFTAKSLLDIMDPLLPVMVGANADASGDTDLSVAVWSFNERGELQCNHTAIIELRKPCAVYRAANILTFGDKPTDDDYDALAQSIDPKKKNQRLENTAKQLGEISEPLKHTISYSNGVAVDGYTSGGVDVTKQLNNSYLKGSVDALHAGLTKVTRQGALDGCRHLAVCDGFTMIGTHLRDLEEHQPGLITANFDSHYALDLTESGSVLKVFQYVANTYFRCPQARHCAMILLAAAAEELGGGDLTAEKSAALKKLLAKLQFYKFDSRVYSQDEDLAESAKKFASGRDSMVKSALEHFAQDFGAIAQHGEYTSANFGVLQYYRENAIQGLPDGEGRDVGRSRCVLRVNFFGKDVEPGSNSGSVCVLKVYDGDAASVKRMERELKAYLRIAQLGKEDQQCIAKLVAFGAIDLGGADPRLFILTEYVENHPYKRPKLKEIQAEIWRVHNVLTSVGVYHNDLTKRNMRWQEVDGKWAIKVFDFDHATFEDVNPDSNQAKNDSDSNIRLSPFTSWDDSDN